MINNDHNNAVFADAHESVQRKWHSAWQWRFCSATESRKVNAEDTELITRVQLGMQSPTYVAGPLGTSEVCLRSFSRKLRRMIPEARLESAPPPGWNRLANAG